MTPPDCPTHVAIISSSDPSYFSCVGRLVENRPRSQGTQNTLVLGCLKSFRRPLTRCSSLGRTLCRRILLVHDRGGPLTSAEALYLRFVCDLSRGPVLDENLLVCHSSVCSSPQTACRCHNPPCLHMPCVAKSLLLTEPMARLPDTRGRPKTKLSCWHCFFRRGAFLCCSGSFLCCWGSFLFCSLCVLSGSHENYVVDFIFYSL